MQNLAWEGQRMFLKHARRVARRELDRGASAVEYGLMVAAIAAVIVGTVFALGQLTSTAFSKTCAGLNADPIGNGTATTCDPNAKPPPAPNPT